MVERVAVILIKCSPSLIQALLKVMPAFGINFICIYIYINMLYALPDMPAFAILMQI